MRCWFLWHGGGSYSTPDVEKHTEEAASLAQVRRIVESRCNRDPYYPCVDRETTEAQVFFVDPRGTRDPYPDRIVRFGRRGGIVTERC